MAVGQVGMSRSVAVSTTTLGDQIIASNPGGGVRLDLIALYLTLSGTGTPTFKLNGSSGDLTGTFDVPGIYTFVGSVDEPLGTWDINSHLRITTGGATVSLRGVIVYLQVPA